MSARPLVASWTPDGDALAFLSDISGVSEAWRVRVTPDAVEPAWPDQLTFGGERVSAAIFSPNR